MNEKKRKLIVLDKTDIQLEEKVEEVVAPKNSQKVSANGQTNPLGAPIMKNLAKFRNAKIGDKLSVKDLIR